MNLCAELCDVQHVLTAKGSADAGAAIRHVRQIVRRASGVAAKERARAPQMCQISPWRSLLFPRPPTAGGAVRCLGNGHKQVNLNTLDYIYPLKTDCYPESRLIGKLILQ